MSGSVVQARIGSLRQVVFLCGLGVLLLSAVGYVAIQQPLAASIALEVKLAKNIGRIMTLDEVLTMSARMAAAAHDPSYEKRYNAHVDELDRTIKATLALIDDREVTRFVASTDTANQRLVQLETQAFELCSKNRHSEALALLESESYRANKQTYASGMQQAFARMTVISTENRRSVEREALVLQVLALVSLCVVVVAWAMDQRERRKRAAAHAQELEVTVERRTAELARRNRGMSLVLDHVAQGFLTMDLNGVMDEERSAVVERWFGNAQLGQTLAAYIGDRAPEFGQWVELGLQQLREGFLPAALIIDQMPKRLSAGGRSFDVTYTPIGDDDRLERLLVVLTDVTQRLAHERAEREQRELVALFQRISVDRSGVEEFLAEGADLVAALREEGSPVTQKRLVHTLKGNCAMYGLESYAELAHDIETELGESEASLSDVQRDALVSVWKEAMLRVAPLLGSARREIFEIDRSELDGALDLARNARNRELISQLQSWSLEPVTRPLERLARQVSVIAGRTGNPKPNVLISTGNVRLSADRWRHVWGAMVHVIRNAVAHGIESAQERAAIGKPEAGTIELRAHREEERIVITVCDDGRGISWDAVRAKAAELGLAHSTRAELVDALFADGLSTRAEADSLAGRGVGLSALREAVRELHGTIQVESERGQGTTFRFVFDERTLMLNAIPVRRVRGSLLPFEV
jgi:HPt (histidine-containing phosphotransfer) domain-containing protein/two-component sensor histidine kinase